MGPIPVHPHVRLLRHINKTEACWFWLGYKNSKGYGMININRIPYYAHRISWESVNGPIPNNLHVLHKCDTPSCVNPTHLFLGTRTDNMSDCKNKERCAHKITLIEAELIRREYESKKNTQGKMRLQESLASQYKVSTRTIRYIVSEGRRLYG